MARTQFTFTFTNAQPGADVGFNFPAFADSSTTVADGATVVLDSTNSVSVWADAAYLIAHTVDGRGVQILGVATSAYPTQTIDAGVPGPNPFPSGGSTQVAVAKTSAYTAANGDVVLANASGANFTVTLPAPAAAIAVTVKNVGATGSVTIAPHAAEHIDGATSLVLSSQFESRDLLSDGTDWWVL